MSGCSQFEGTLEKYGRGVKECLIEKLDLGRGIESLRPPCVQQAFEFNGNESTFVSSRGEKMTFPAT